MIDVTSKLLSTVYDIYIYMLLNLHLNFNEHLALEIDWDDLGAPVPPLPAPV